MVEALLVSQFVAAGAMLLLAGWLLWLNLRSAVNRSFAVFLVFRAAVIVANRMKGIADDAGHADEALFWQAIREYYNLALAPSLLYFWVAYSGMARQTAWRAAIVVAALAMEGAYLANHCLELCTGPNGLIVMGPLAPFGNPGFLAAMGVVGFMALRESLRLPHSPRRKAAFPVAVGLLLSPLLEVSLIAGIFLRVGPHRALAAYTPSVWVWLVHAVLLLGVLFPAVASGWTAWVAVRTPTMQGKAKGFLLFALLAAASGLFLGWNAPLGSNWLPGIFILGLWRTLLPALVAYALVRHRLFGVEVRLKWTLVRAMMAFTFLGVFFVAAQLAQNYLSSALGWSLGGVAAGLLLFAVSPIQRMAERFTQAVLPHTKPVASMAHPERLDLFRHQAVLVWSDGAMGRKERALLDALREHLALPFEDAARIETEAAAHAPLHIGA